MGTEATLGQARCVGRRVKSHGTAGCGKSARPVGRGGAGGDRPREDTQALPTERDSSRYGLATVDLLPALLYSRPVQGFGVGTMAVSTPGAPSLGAVYKLVALEDAQGKRVAVEKRSPGKGSAAGAKQVMRSAERFADLLVVDGETAEGTPLLELVFDGKDSVGDHSLDAARARLRADIARAPEAMLSVAPRREEEGFPVAKSAALEALHGVVAREGRAAFLPDLQRIPWRDID